VYLWIHIILCHLHWLGPIQPLLQRILMAHSVRVHRLVHETEPSPPSSFASQIKMCGAYGQFNVYATCLLHEVFEQVLTYTHYKIEPMHFLWSSVYIVKYKGKTVLLQAWGGPEGSRNLRFPDFMTMAQDGGKVVSHTHRPPLPQGNTPGTHFC